MITVDSDGNALPAGFDAAASSPEHTVVKRLRLDFGADGFGALDDLSSRTASLSIDRGLATDLPGQVRIVEGLASAQLSAGLAGGEDGDDTTTAASYFTRGNPTSPVGALERIRRPVTADIGYAVPGVGPVYVRRFTGRSRSLTTSAAQGTAALEALDRRELMRNPVRLIPVDGNESGCEGTWIVFQALAANGIYAGPAPRAAGSLVWLPMYGSLVAVTDQRESTWIAAILDGTGTFGIIRPRFRPGPFVLATDDLYHIDDAHTQRLYINMPGNTGLADWDGLTGRFEAWVLGVDNPTTGIPGTDGRMYLFFEGSTDFTKGWNRVGLRHDGRLFFDTFDNTDVVIHAYSSTFIVPGDGAYHFLGVHFDMTAQRVTFRLDDRVETVATAFGAAEILAPVDTLLFTSYVSVSDVHLHGPIAEAAPWLIETLDIQATIDRSTLVLAACFEDQEREPWELLTEVADAEQATAMFDEADTFRYQTRARQTSDQGQTVQQTLTGALDVLDLVVEDGIDQVRNIVQITYNPVDVPGLYTFVYRDTEHRVIPAYSFLDVVVSPQNPVVQLGIFAFFQDVTGFEIFSESLGDAMDPYFVLTFNSDFSADTTVLSYYSSFTAEVIRWTPRAFTVRVTNRSPYTVYMAGLGLKGKPVIVGNQVMAEARDATSVEQWGAQPLQISTTQWVQRHGVAEGLARALVGDLKRPRRYISRVRVVGDPRRQLTDRVALSLRSRPELDGEYWLSTVNDDVGDDGSYIQELDLREATDVLRWGIGHWGIETWG